MTEYGKAPGASSATKQTDALGANGEEGKSPLSRVSDSITGNACSMQERTQDPNASTFAGDAEGNVRLRIARAEAWLDANTQAWGYMLELAENEAAHQRHFSFNWLVEEARKRAFIDSAGEPFAINNTFVPYLLRVMLNERPDFRPFMSKPRRSMYDRWFIEAEQPDGA